MSGKLTIWGNVLQHRFRNYFRILLVVLVVVAGFTVKEFTRVTRSVYTQIAEVEGRAMRDRLALFLTPPAASLSLAGGFLSQLEPGVPSAKDMFGLFAPVLNEQKAVCAVALSDGNGLLGILQRRPEGYLAVIRLNGSNQEYQWSNLDSNLESVGQAKPDQKALQSLAQALPANGNGLKAGQPVWSGRFELPKLSGGAIAATVAAGPESSKGLKLSFCFSLSEIRETCLKESGSMRERVLIFSSSGQALDFGRFETQASPLFAGPEQVSGETAAALRAWRAGQFKSQESYVFSYSGEPWWAWLGPLSEAEQALQVGLAIPQEDLLAQFAAGKKTLFVMAGGIFILLWLMIFLLVFMRRQRQAKAAGFFDSPAEVEALLKRGESERLEFKSSLRQNLATGKPGKEIELASLKTIAAFMNSDGGVLAVGVDDNGQALGLSADGFENADHLMRHFSSIVNQHLGLECARYLRFGLREAFGAGIFLVRCERSQAPVFLKNGKDEEFYIRVGPSSRKLSLSQFHRYLSTHKPPEENLN